MSPAVTHSVLGELISAKECNFANGQDKRNASDETRKNATCCTNN